MIIIIPISTLKRILIEVNSLVSPCASGRNSKDRINWKDCENDTEEEKYLEAKSSEFEKKSEYVKSVDLVKYPELENSVDFVKYWERVKYDESPKCWDDEKPVNQWNIEMPKTFF